MKKNRITIIGASILDVLAGPVNEQVFRTGSQAVERTGLSFGGDALNEGVVLSRLGMDVQLISKVGRDEAGKRILEYAGKSGMDTTCILQEEGLATGINIVLIDERGERHFLTNPQSNLRKLCLEDILPHIDKMGEIVSFASIFVSPLLDIQAMEQLFKKIKEKPGRILAADMTKAKAGETLEDIKCLLPYIDYIFPNEEEIALLTGSRDNKRNAELLVESGVGCAVIKCGSRGCLIQRKETVLEIPAYPVEKVVDTTGAGDCFTASFLWAISQGWSLAECGKFACSTASFVVEGMGAAEGIGSLEEILERYKK